MQRGLELFEELVKDAEPIGSDDLSGMMGSGLAYSRRHVEVVAAWGRFPHRNAILGRQDTPEETEGLAAGTIAKF